MAKKLRVAWHRRMKGRYQAACAGAGFWCHFFMQRKIRKINLLLGLLVISLVSGGIAYGDVSAPEVIKNLVADATRTPPGPVENNVTSQTVATCTAAKKGFKDSRSVRELIAASYNDATLVGPLTCFYSQGAGEIWCGKAKLTVDGIAECRDEASSSATVIAPGKPGETTAGSTPMFGDGGAFSTFVGSRVPDNGIVIASFCVVQQHGAWKVHCIYLSPDLLSGDDKSFVIRQFGAFVTKQ